MKSLCLLFALVSVASAEPRMERYVLLLSDPPVAKQVLVRKGTRTPAAVSRIQLLQDKQRALTSTLKARGVHVIGSVQTIVNAVFVGADASQLDMLKALPGVTRVVRDTPLKRHLNKALDLMDVPAAWTALGGVGSAGTGTRIAIVDTGIDQTHPAFQDTSLTVPSGFPKCDSAAGECDFTNNKVIAARSYVKMLNFLGGDTNPAFTRPDDFTPRDRVGHGTAAAMIAAGEQNTSPAGITITGVAPKAFLGNYKVFGSPGVNDLTYSSVVVQALDDVLADGFDVAVVPLGTAALWQPADSGATCGNSGTDPCDWRSAAIQNAVNAGLLVVVSAGNDGDLGSTSPLGSINTPGTAPAAITVGSTSNGHVIFQGLTINGSGVPSQIASLNTYFGNGPRPNSPLKAKVVDVTTTGNNGQACSTLPAGSLNGAIVLIKRGACVFATKVINAANAGAVGVIIYQDQSNGIFYITGLETTPIPTVIIGNDTGTALKTYLASHSDATATLDPTLRITDTTNSDIVAFFSSQGPSIDGILKPELVAVGTDLYTATQKYDPNSDLYNASGYTSVQGSSFAAAFVGGAAALMYQTGPTLTPAQVKSLLVNTADVNVFELDSSGNKVSASIEAVGAGKLDVAQALKADVTAVPATLSFGFIRTTTRPVISLVVTNVGSQTRTLTLTAQPVNSDPNSSLVIAPPSVALGPGQSSTVTISVNGVPSAGSWDGDVVISGGAVTEHVPYLYLQGNNIPANIIPLESTDWVLPAGYPHLILGFKVLDRFGVPVANVPVSFSATQGGGSIQSATAATDSLGIAEALQATVGPNPGDQEFKGSTTDGSNLTVFFDGRARAVPTIASAGVTDAATGLTQGFAPGSYITIKGQGLSDATQQSRTNYLPVALGGTSVSFDAPGSQISVPGHISYASPGQVNVQVPWELQGISQASIKVSLDSNAATAPVTIPITAYAPGAFEFKDATGVTLAATLDEKYAYVTTQHPLQRGHVVQLFLNGLGPVDTQPASGDPSPLNPLSHTKSAPTVTVGNVNAPVTFTGLAPGIVGLYQVNAQIPANAPTGVQPLVISIGGVTSKTSALPIQ